MNIEIKEQNGTYVGILSGWLDTNESSQFIEDLKVLEENIDKPIVLDCKNLEYICSLALRGLLKLKKESAAKGETEKRKCRQRGPAGIEERRR